MKDTTLEGRAKTKNGVARLAFSVLCILLEVVFIVALFTRLNRYAEALNLLTRVLGLIVILNMYASPVTSTIKMPWILLILAFPIMGLGLYLLVGLNGGTAKMRKRYQKIDEQLLPCLPQNRTIQKKLEQILPKAGNISSYIYRNAFYPVYQNTDCDLLRMRRQRGWKHSLLIWQKQSTLFLWSTMQSKMPRRGSGFSMCWKNE